jgi:hypothetical protein
MMYSTGPMAMCSLLVDGGTVGHPSPTPEGLSQRGAIS